MSIQKRALLMRNQFGFKVAAKVYEDGSFSVRLFNFIKQPTNANTLPKEEAIKLRDFLNACYPKREPVLARPEHGCSVEEAMALTMERYGQPGGALEQLAELERDPPKEPVVLREYQELERDTGRLIVRPAPPTELACGKCNRAPSEIAVCQHWECGVYSREVTK